MQGLRRLFEVHGNVTYVAIPKMAVDGTSTVPKGTAFVEFEKPEFAAKALEVEWRNFRVISK